MQEGGKGELTFVAGERSHQTVEPIIRAAWPNFSTPRAPSVLGLRGVEVGLLGQKH
jgi:hypothetical protein